MENKCARMLINVAWCLGPFLCIFIPTFVLQVVIILLLYIASNLLSLIFIVVECAIGIVFAILGIACCCQCCDTTTCCCDCAASGLANAIERISLMMECKISPLFDVACCLADAFAWPFECIGDIHDAWESIDARKALEQEQKAAELEKRHIVRWLDQHVPKDLLKLIFEFEGDAWKMFAEKTWQPQVECNDIVQRTLTAVVTTDNNCDTKYTKEPHQVV